MKVTLANLHKATEQQVFTQVKNHLLKQKEKSINAVGSCAYRGTDGKMCAAGCLIDDSEYKESMEGANWDSVVLMGLAPDSHIQLIQDLQEIHDSPCAPCNWVEDLEILAISRDLDYEAE